MLCANQSDSNEATEHGSNGTKIDVMSKHYFLLHVTRVFLFIFSFKIDVQEKNNNENKPAIGTFLCSSMRMAVLVILLGYLKIW